MAVETPGKDRLAAQRRALPDQPGVYLFRDARGRVIYVGKAKSIRKRVASHFSARGTMVAFIDHIESLVVASEQEALLTEQTFIKQYKPRFNIRLRDDKSYPYIAISLDEPFPRVYFTRERHRRERVYFGPYSSAKRVRGTLDLLGKIFLFRSCEGAEPGRRSGSPCLDYYIKRCGAPCVGYVSEAEYREGIDGVVAFLSGRFRQIERDLERRMYHAAGEQDYEQAALERNRLQAVRQLLERQRVASEGAGTFDAVAIAVDGMEANAQVFQVRDGVLSDRQSFYLDNQGEQEPAIVAEEFLLQYYTSALAIPSLIVVEQELAEGSEPEILAALLSERRGGAVEIRAAERGRQAAHPRAGRAQRAPRARPGEAQGRAAPPAAGRLPHRPAGRAGARRAARAHRVLRHLQPRRHAHRRLDGRLRGRRAKEGRLPPFHDQDRGRIGRFRVDGRGAQPALCAVGEAGGEVALRRRSRRLVRRPAQPRRDRRRAGPALRGPARGAGLPRRGVAVVSLAKRIEEVFLPGVREPLRLPHETPELQLLQRVRDEAHRFAITHHRIRRDRAMTESIMDDLPGVGPARKRALLLHFGSPEAVLGASREQLEAVPGVPPKVARDLYAHLNKTGR